MGYRICIDRCGICGYNYIYIIYHFGLWVGRLCQINLWLYQGVVKMKPVRAWESKDGKLFKSAADCLEYEKIFLDNIEFPQYEVDLE